MTPDRSGNKGTAEDGIKPMDWSPPHIDNTARAEKLNQREGTGKDTPSKGGSKKKMKTNTGGDSVAVVSPQEDRNSGTTTSQDQQDRNTNDAAADTGDKAAQENSTDKTGAGKIIKQDGNADRQDSTLAPGAKTQEGVNADGDPVIRYSINLDKKVTPDWQMMYSEAGSHNGAPLYTIDDVEEKSLRAQVYDILAAADKELDLSTDLTKCNGEMAPSIQRLKSLVYDSCKSQNDRKTGMTHILCQKMRRIATKVTKTPPSYFGDLFEFATKEGRATLQDHCATRFWTA